METESPQAKVISNAQISQPVERATEIKDVILIISFFSRLGPPRVFQPRPVLGGQLGRTGDHGECEDTLNLRFLHSAAHFPVKGRREKADWQVSGLKRS